MHLFSFCAFGKRFPKPEFVELSRYIVNYIEGLPLALKVLGGFLHHRTVSYWEEVLDKLKHQPMKEIQDVLKISYDRLDLDAQNIFLDIACFFNGEERELVSRISDGSVKAMRELNHKSLITFSNNKVLMHPSIQQMGQEVVYQESPKEPGRRSRLWRSEDVHYILSSNQVRAKCLKL